MAQLVSRGTLARNRWDFFEAGDAFACMAGLSVSGGTNLIYLLNNVPQVQFDIYRVDFACASALPGVAIQILLPGTTLGDSGGGQRSLSYLEVIQSAPAGKLAVIGPPVSSVLYNVYYRPDSITNFSFELSAGPLATLPPLWAIAVNVTTVSSVLCGVTFWYQQLLDLVTPAQ